MPSSDPAYEKLKIRRAEYYKKRMLDPEFAAKRKEYNAAWFKRNREYCNLKAREWAERNRDKQGAASKACRDRKKMQYILRNAKKRAKATGKDFDLELTDIVLPEKCPIFGVPLNYGPSTDNPDFSPSLDRIDSSKGYVKGNVQVISRLANCMKWTATPEQLIAFARGILALHT